MTEYDFDVVEVGDEFHYQETEDVGEIVGLVKGVHWSTEKIVLDVENEFGDEFEIEMPREEIGGDDYTVELVGWNHE